MVFSIESPKKVKLKFFDRFTPCFKNFSPAADFVRQLRKIHCSEVFDKCCLLLLLLCAGHCAKPFEWIISATLHL